MKTSMTIFRAIEIACKSLMSSGAYTQDDRAAAYDVLVAHSAHLSAMIKTDTATFSKEDPKSVPQDDTKAEVSKWTHLYNGVTPELKGKRCYVEKVTYEHVIIRVEDIKYARHITHNVFKTFPTINGKGVFEAFAQKYESKLKKAIEGLDFINQPVNVPMTTCFEIINATESMNDAGFFNGMKFIPVQGTLTLRNSYMLEHIRSGKTCRMPAKFVREIQMPTAKVNALMDKRGMKKYDF